MMARLDELRLMTKAARMYYEQNMRQADIARQLDMSQATVSRLFKRAREEGIVRITVQVPQGVYPELEEQLVERFTLRDAVVVDVLLDDETLIQRELGVAAAAYLESIIRNNEVIGISSWSSTLLAMVDAMNPLSNKSGIQVVQTLGGVGNPAARSHATRLTSQLASLVNGTPVFLPAPGIVGSEASVQVLLEDPYVQRAMRLFDEVTIALIGIGTVAPSKLLAESGNIFQDEELASMREKGAVGDIHLRFFDASGAPVHSDLDKRVISMSLEALRGVERAIGVAGGARKHRALLGALRGGWINVLVIDRFSAERLVHT